MIAVSSRLAKRNWNTISFASTLYLVPILDLLLSEIPSQWRQEVRLGLQEALVNAAKHGNQLDPNKTVLVRFSVVSDQYWWVITDQGNGFKPSKDCLANLEDSVSCYEKECGRGLYILHQVFDKVQWNRQGTELRLCKQVKHSFRAPVIS